MIYGLIPFVSSIFVLGIGCFVLSQNFRSRLYFVFFLFCLTMSIWLFGTFKMFTVETDELAIWWDRFIYVGVVFIPITLYHFGCIFVGKEIKNKKTISPGYVLSFVFLILSRTDYFVAGLYKYRWGVHTQAKILHHIFLVFFLSYFALFFAEIYGYYRRSAGIKREATKYLFIAFLILGIGPFAYLPAYGIGVYFAPSYFAGLIFTATVAYAILKHRLMNIDVVIKKSVTDFLLFLGISVISILIILGIENKFYQGINLRMLNFSFILLLIPGAYLFRRLKPATEKKVEKMLFKDKYDYLESLAKLGQRAVTCLDLDKLLDDVVNSLAGGLKLDDVAVYIFQEDAQEYYLAKDLNPANKKVERLTLFDPRVAFLNGRGRIIVWDEERQCSPEVLARVNEAKIAVTVPLVFEKKMVGIVQLSDKTSKEIYSQEDLELLHALAERISSGLANAKEHGASDELYRIRSRHERITSLAELGAGLCHQLNNPLTPIKTFLQRLDPEKHNIGDMWPFREMAAESVERIIKIIKEVDAFSEAGLNIAHIQMDVNALLRKAVPIICSNSGNPDIEVKLDLEEGLPTILGDERALLDIFVAIGTNGMEAMLMRPAGKDANVRALLEKGLPPEALVKFGLLGDVKDAEAIMAEKEKKKDNKLVIRTRAMGKEVTSHMSHVTSYVQVEITDTGCGIKPGDLAKIFNPMHSTKSMHIGLSLAIAHRLVEAHGGYMDVKSKVGEGTSFFVNLPLAYNPSRKETTQDKEAQRSGQRGWEAVVA